MSIQPYTNATTTPKKDRKRKKNSFIGHVHIDINSKREENIVRKPCMTK